MSGSAGKGTLLPILTTSAQSPRSSWWKENQLSQIVFRLPHTHCDTHTHTHQTNVCMKKGLDFHLHCMDLWAVLLSTKGVLPWTLQNVPQVPWALPTRAPQGDNHNHQQMFPTLDWEQEGAG